MTQTTDGRGRSDGMVEGAGHGGEKEDEVKAIVGGNTRQPAGMSEEEGEAGMGHNERGVAGNWSVAGAASSRW